jgi:cellulose synthase/poly-beta-1,6-N-acetylglucosamine synthase-like glycosyltransferase
MALAIFLSALGLLAYTMAGYPALLWLLARRRPRPARRDPAAAPAVEAILVVHNEGGRIRAKLDNLLALDYPADRLAITVVSDGSDDDTGAQVRALGNPRVRLLAFPAKSTKAACLDRAIGQARAELLLLTDARQRLATDALRRLVAPMADPAVGAVSGELMFQAEGHNDFSKGVEAYWAYEKFIRKHEAQIDSAVGVTGAIYLLRRAAYRPIPAHTLLDDVLIPMQTVLAGYRVLFEEQAHAFDVPSADPEREKRRKIRTIAGNFQLVALAPALLNPWRNRLWWQFVSHKLLRLAAPLLLLAVLLSSLALAPRQPVFALLLGGQLAAYGILLGSLRWPWLRQLRLVRIGRAFMSLMYFTVLGSWTFLRGRHLSSWR